MRQVDNGEIELPEDNGEGFEIDGFASPNVMKFVNYFITAMYALVPGTLVSRICFLPRSRTKSDYTLTLLLLFVDRWMLPFRLLERRRIFSRPLHPRQP